MKENKKVLEGSPTRDRFKMLHKKLMPGSFYASDLDLILIQKPPQIIGFVDYKQERDTVQFSEVVVYEILKDVAPIYIIKGKDPNTGPFRIWQYIKGDYRPNPPTVDLQLVRQCENWQILKEWEAKLRNESRK